MAFIDTLNNPIVREMQKDYNRAIAQKIRNRLQQLENANEKDERRWVWELLQNANDTVSGERKVDIKIIVTAEGIEFNHNGGYFSPRNITNLVHQISSKEGEENIGRFGTGFLTTHTLSRVTEVSGVYSEEDKYSQFKITLDRTGNTEAELVKCLEKTWETFEEVKLEGKPKEVIWTSFKYLDHNKKVVEDTINDFETFIHYNLAFVQSIGSITVDNKLTNSHFSIQRKTTQVISELLSIIPFELIRNKQKIGKKLLLANNIDVQAAIEINNDNSNGYSITKIAKNIPRLFCAFPLIGTETFHFPMVLNSPKFMPKTERDGLYLKGDTKEARQNKPILETALSLYYSALEFSYHEKAENLHLLAQHENPFQDDHFDIQWYKNAIQEPIQNQLLISPIVKTKIGTFETIKTIKFPYHARDKNLDLNITEQLWEFQAALYPSSIPQKSDIKHWANIIWEDYNKISLGKFAKFIQEFETTDKLADELKKISNIESFAWLNNVIGFYIEKASYILNKYKICPNQEKISQGRFCFKDDLYVDNNIQEELKDVYEIFTKVKPWREELLARQITTLENLLTEEKKVRHRINIIQGINARIEHEDTNKEEVRNAVFNLIRLIPLEKAEHNKFIRYFKTTL